MKVERFWNYILDSNMLLKHTAVSAHDKTYQFIILEGLEDNRSKRNVPEIKL